MSDEITKVFLEPQDFNFMGFHTPWLNMLQDYWYPLICPFGINLYGFLLMWNKAHEIIVQVVLKQTKLKAYCSMHIGMCQEDDQVRLHKRWGSSVRDL